MLKYNEPVFRPPAEAYSLILQATYGCSWNKCSFCEMYRSKQFHKRNFAELEQEIVQVGQSGIRIKKIFLADGNAFVLSAEKLLQILSVIQSKLGRIQRVSSYALPSDILAKSVDELRAIRKAGLKLLYIGVESGSNEVLCLNKKSETYETTRDGIVRAQDAGFDVSVMILNGLGGKQLSDKHAVETARLINEVQPKLLSSLVLSFPFEISHYQNRLGQTFEPLSSLELLAEMRMFIEHTNLRQTIFRSDHASNYVALDGILGRDKERLLSYIDSIIKKKDTSGFRPEWMRGL